MVVSDTHIYTAYWNSSERVYALGDIFSFLSVQRRYMRKRLIAFDNWLSTLPHKEKIVIGIMMIFSGHCLGKTSSILKGSTSLTIRSSSSRILDIRPQAHRTDRTINHAFQASKERKLPSVFAHRANCGHRPPTDLRIPYPP